MDYSLLIFNIFFLFISSTYSKDYISCSLHDIYAIQENGDTAEIYIDGQVNVTYERSNLSIYSYNNTKYANFLLSDVDIIFTGIFSNSSDPLDNKISVTLPTHIEGTAVHSKTQNRAQLTDSELDLKKNIEYRDDLHQIVQEKIADSAHVCIQTKLCEKLGSATEDDYIRAKIENHDFGENSVMYKIFHESYPMLDDSEKNSQKAGLQITLNLLADFFLASAASRVSGTDLGKIDIPDIEADLPGKLFFKGGYFKMSKASFGDLTTLKRITDVFITNQGLEFKLEAGFQLTKARILSDFDAKWSFFHKQGLLEIILDNVRCTIRASMNYNRRPCVSALQSIHFEVGELSFELNNGKSVLDSAIAGIVNQFIESYTDNIILAVQTKVKDLVDNLLANFDCEKYRP